MNQTLKMDQLWKIALSAQNTDVSMKAIQILNSAYFGQGEEFLVQCMQNLLIKELSLGSEEVLTKIQRALLLLKTYLETFRRKYAYHFRRMSIDGQGVLTHAELVDLKSLGPIRYVIFWLIFNRELVSTVLKVYMLGISRGQEVLKCIYCFKRVSNRFKIRSFQKVTKSNKK